jgi:Uma2 family endonuclease
MLAKSAPYAAEPVPMLEGERERGTAMGDVEHGPECAEEHARDGFLKLDTPEGYRAEFIEGQIVVSPPPLGDHEYIFALINEQVTRDSVVRMHVSGHKGLVLPSGGRCTKNYVIPDGVVAPRELKLFKGADSWMPPDGIAMVFEVTSSKPEQDRETKRHCYARAGIPLYLLVDRAAKTVTLFGEPDEGDDDYREDVRVGFGKPVDLPAPFGFALDTEDFY